MSKTNSFLISAIIIMLFSCEKEPGVGGNGSICGKIITYDYNKTFTKLSGIYPAADHYVYIVYGNNIGYDKRIKTDYNGDYCFKFLYPGNYVIYTYSADTTMNIISGKVVVKSEICLAKDNHFINPDMIVYE